MADDARAGHCRRSAAGGLVIALAAPTAYTFATVTTPQSGAIPSAGPAGVGGFGGRAAPGAGGPAVAPEAASGGQTGAGTGGQATPSGAGGAVPRPDRHGGFGPGARGGAPGGIGGLLNAGTPSAELTPR